MTNRTMPQIDPIDDAMRTLAWLRGEQVSIGRIQALVQQHPEVFGAGDSSLEVAAEYLEGLVKRRGNLTLIDTQIDEQQ